ncbi:methyl-CpG-binding domain protein 4-like isoform X2 [Plodia interpunctella]|nr:methyl-CpG-binding domain protein 4-like isoform X2 [Plodia interpunctella]XP_053617675.1 methyl-CpG-binding domain protein 4-like isoform X2 [Plodia interpunctella]XP_053617676.1 methyl-CpG-binding domain protein 4-like isoform X2 [Plodia interpunctella]XP_053617678.1 methyl-CpG-binding domain protein 4-like isoform X2 [Plodia interpunctella]
MADDTCTSRFFQDTDLASTSPNRIPVSSSEPLNPSPDTSQHSFGSDDADVLSLSTLCIEEQKPLHIQTFYNITPREMPVSPHYIFEEEFSTNPWAMLIATIFLTKTSGRTARPNMKMFFEEYPTPYHVLRDNPKSLERFFENLGLRKRGHMIWKLTYQFVSSKWRRASDLVGIGKYGEDAYRIFCLGHTDLDPEDRYLRLYLDWLRNHTEFPESHGIADSEFIIQDPSIKYYKITLRN